MVLNILIPFTAIGHIGTGMIAGLIVFAWGTPLVHSVGEVSDKALVLDVYQKFGFLAAGFGVLLFLVSPLINRFMHMDTLVDRRSNGA